MSSNIFVAALTLVVASSEVYSDTIKLVTVEEYVSKKVQVSGHFLHGIQQPGLGKVNRLSALFPKGSTGGICVDISSVDGEYKAKFSHKLSAPVSGEIILDFETKYRDKWMGYPSGQLAVLTRLSDDCEENRGKLLVSSWDGIKEDGSILLLIRSDARKDSAKVNGSKKAIKCKRFRTGYNVVYDKYCRIENTSISELSSIIVERKNLQSIPSEEIKMGYVE